MTVLWPIERTLALRGVRYRLHAAGQGAPLLLLHGFAGSAATWNHLVPHLVAAGWLPMAPDLLGHGASDAPSDPRRYTAHEQVADLVALLDAFHIAQTAVVGYSMGGRLALHLALAVPERVSSLVLESASPGIADPAERAVRQRNDEELAQAIEERGLHWFADYWEALPLFASRQQLPASTRAWLRTQWLAQRPAGLAASLRGFGTGTMPSVWERLHELRCPVLVITGALDERYVAIGRAMADALPRGALVVVPDAGHTVHLEQPDRFFAAVAAFLRR